LKLDNTKDYILKMPSYQLDVLAGLVVVGGHNVVLIGGSITIPYAGSSPTINDRRALYFNGQTGTVHVEGVLIDDTGGDLSEGIQIAAPNATVQVENVRVTGIHARDESGWTDNHPDLIQSWGGVKVLRVDRFSGSTDYQGMNVTPPSGTTTTAYLYNINTWSYPADKARYQFWQGTSSGYATCYTQNYYIKPATGRTLVYTGGATGSVWPDGSGSDPHRAHVDSNGNAYYPSGGQVTGVISAGAPSGGDFVPLGLAGLNYRSPGYL